MSEFAEFSDDELGEMVEAYNNGMREARVATRLTFEEHEAAEFAFKMFDEVAKRLRSNGD